MKTLRYFAVALIAVVAGATSTEAARVMWSETPADPVRPDRGSDPVEVQVRREILSRLPELRQKPAPFLRIDIPDPREAARQISLREQTSESSTPVTASGIPPRPVLVVPPAAPAK